MERVRSSTPEATRYMPCTHTTRRRSRRASALAAVVTAVVALAATGGVTKKPKLELIAYSRS
jgi:hypothetical protein